MHGLDTSLPWKGIRDCGKEGVRHRAVGETSPRVFSSVALNALGSERMSSPYSDWESIVSCGSKDVRCACDRESRTGNVRQRNAVRDYEELWFFDAVVQLLSRSVGTDHVLFGVLGKRQLAPLCKI